MAVTLADDHTTIEDAESATDQAADNTVLGTTGALDSTFFIEGSNSNKYQAKAAGVGAAGYFNSGNNFNSEYRHIYVWFLTLDQFNTEVNDGYRIRIADDNLSSDTNFGEWSVGGGDTRRVFIKGFGIVCIDTRRPFDFESGTIPSGVKAVTSYDSIGFGGDMLSGSGQSTFFLDIIKHTAIDGGIITVTGGTTGARGNSTEIATADEASGTAYGCFKNVVGVFYLLTGLIIGNTAAADSFFEDAGETWVFEAQSVAGTFYKVAFVGNSGQTTLANFGTPSGSGPTKEGSGGNTFLSAGAVPFRFDCLDANIDVDFMGCNFIGPAALYDDFVRDFVVEDNSAPSFTDDTTDFNDPGATDTPMMPGTEAVNDACYFGNLERFYEITIDLGTAKGGVWTGTWEYSTAAGWSSLTDVTDGTSDLSTLGVQAVTYSIPDDWVTRAVNSRTQYWIRFRISSFTSAGTTPSADEGSVKMAGDVRLEVSSIEAIRCVFSQMGSIRVRNGAFLKKCVITDSVVATKHAAIDLGGADPTTDTVRDLTVQNCLKGILLKGSGNVTYNFRNIKFSNNTNDVRVDFGSGDTVTINVLEGGDTPTIDNVNSSTVVVQNTVTLQVTVKDVAGVAVRNAFVGIFRDDTGAQLMNRATLANGIATESFAFVSDTAVSVRVRKGSGPEANSPTFGQVWQVDVTGPATFDDQTDEANDATDANWTVFPTSEEVGDYVAIGNSDPFGKVVFDNANGTAGSGGVVVWEYWNGTAWSVLTEVTDGTSGFTAAVADGQTLDYTIPTDWSRMILNGSENLYYIRARITTVYTTNPVYDQGFIGAQTQYLPVNSPQTITSGGLTTTVTMIVDTVNSS